MGWWARAAVGEGKGWWQRAWRGMVVVAKGTTVCHVTFTYVGFLSQVNGPSMFPTFEGRGWNVVLAEALPGLHDRVGVGDVVICTRPVNAREAVIKRVTAVAGQTVTLYSRNSPAPTRLEARTPPLPPCCPVLLVLSTCGRAFGLLF
ncbi:MAG: hypothetical protein J3K34DRAFT_414229 [Monoraphidium minutum]|nr:MAG: hypothetical protein J3K34DRAFT_414229 [Monoraphidium minutum]